LVEDGEPTPDAATPDRGLGDTEVQQLTSQGGDRTGGVDTLQYSQRCAPGTHAAALLVAAALVTATGCSGGDTTTAARPPAPDGSWYFVGTGADGLGAAVDLLADHPVHAPGRAALARVATRTGHPAPAVGLVCRW